MFLKIKHETHRPTLRLTADQETAYPKGKRSVPVSVQLDGEAVEMQVTSSAQFSTNPTTGANGYIRIKGKVYWVAFDHGFNAAQEELIFTLHDGTGPDKNPVREPKKPKVEARRIELFKITYASRHFSA